MKLHGDDEGWVKKVVLTIGLFAVLISAGEPAYAGDTQSSQNVGIHAVAPAVFGAGAKIVIKGTGFLAEDTVYLGTIELQDLKIKSTSIQASVPAKAKRGTKLILRRGKKKIATFSAFDFAKAPVLRKSKPPFGVPGGPMTILGANLETVDKLKVENTSIKIQAAEKKSLTFIIPKGLSTGILTVSGPGGAATLKKPLEIFYPPVIAEVEPKAAFPGDVVSVSGDHFNTKGIRFYIGKKKVKPTEVTSKTAKFIVPNNAKSGVIKATARRVTAESKAEFTVYPIPMLKGGPRMVASPGSLQVRGKNLDVVEKWSINGKTLKPDSTFTKRSSRLVQLKIPEDMVTEGVVTATYKKRDFKAKKATKIAAAPQIRAVRFVTAEAGCEYTVIGKNFSGDTSFKLGRKKLTPMAVKGQSAVLGMKGSCSSTYNRISAKNGRVSGNTFTFNPKAGGYAATPEEAAARLTAGSTDYTSQQIESDLVLMESRFAGTLKSFEDKGKAAGGSAEKRKEVDRISSDVGDALVRLALAEEALCKAMAPGKKAAAANAAHGTMLDRVVKKEKHLMQNVLIPLWSKLPKAAMAKNKGVRLDTVDNEVVLIDAVEKQKKTCANKYYGKKVVAEAVKVAAVNLTALHEKALMGALSNLSPKNKNTVIVEKDLNDALYSFESNRRSYWVTKAKKTSSKVQKTGSKTVGKGAGKNKQVEKSSKQKPKGKTGKGKGK